VIGINAQIASNGSTASGEGQSNGVGFAIPVNTAKTVISQLEKAGHVSHAYLGVATSDASHSGAVVESVVPGGPAEKAGIAQGDVIRSIDGTAVSSADDVTGAISGHSPGDKITVGITRNGKSQTFTVTLGQQPSQAPSG
jgi:putative serine protease PepD